MAEIKFIGREIELQHLNDLLMKKTASLVVIKGRRRIGKSRLVEEFARGKLFYHFSGLAPIEGVTAQHQRDEFSYLLNQQTGLPEIQTTDWSKLFSLLNERTKKGRVIIFLDEITWMAQDDPSFLPKLKNAWDLYYKKNPQLILILCGSISAWIEKNIVSSTGYFGRITQKITLRELSIQQCDGLLKAVGFKRSAYEKFLILSLTGGVPWYIEQINPGYSAADNIKRLCFEPEALMVEEHHHIFHDLFGKKSAIYQKITQFLSSGAAEYKAIAKGIQYSNSGALSRYLDELMISGYINREHSWSFKTGKESKIVTYRLSDNYLRFYYKYIHSKINKINNGQYKDINVTHLKSWEAMMSLQFENLVLNNKNVIHQALRLHPEDITADNPYYQRQTARHKGCQIDYLIQTRFNTLFVCEIKFSKHEIKASVISEVKERIRRLAVPRGYSCMPVLIHINGVMESVIDSDYFFECIDFSEFIG
jgi:uncharacterized protein